MQQRKLMNSSQKLRDIHYEIIAGLGSEQELKDHIEEHLIEIRKLAQEASMEQRRTCRSRIVSHGG